MKAKVGITKIELFEAVNHIDRLVFDGRRPSVEAQKMILRFVAAHGHLLSSQDRLFYYGRVEFIANACGISEQRYRRAHNRLIEKGWIRKTQQFSISMPLKTIGLHEKPFRVNRGTIVRTDTL
ncbi:hypothetical protein F4X90_17355 [Candidatus Poribacteria bacterium]|nr:hypothetical protein [Candidatus Poribacteria bacterium]